jgi:hypothetical protein
VSFRFKVVSALICIAGFTASQACSPTEPAEGVTEDIDESGDDNSGDTSASKPDTREDDNDDSPDPDTDDSNEDDNTSEDCTTTGCPDGQHCEQVSGECHSGCANDDHCDFGEACDAGTCTPETVELLTYTFAGESKSPAQTAEGISVSDIDNEAGDAGFVSGQPDDALTDTGWDDGNVFRFEIIPEDNRRVGISSITFDERPSGTGPTDFEIYAESDKLSEKLRLGTGTTERGSWSNQTVEFPSDSPTMVAEKLVVTIEATGATSSRGTWRIDNVSADGAVVGSDGNNGQDEDNNDDDNDDSGECTQCPNGCFNLDSDPDNCGSCGYTCEGGVAPEMRATCDSGECKVMCSGGKVGCEPQSEDGCFDLETSKQHCGQCGNTCSSDEVCVGGECSDCSEDADCSDKEVCSSDNTCECAPGLTRCEGECFDTDTSNEHCGGCDTGQFSAGTDCLGSPEYCAGGECVECESDSDCLLRDEPYCKQGVCHQCTSDSHCTTGDKTICTSLLECAECESDSDCSGEDVCNRQGECVRCTRGEDCPGEMLCSLNSPNSCYCPESEDNCNECEDDVDCASDEDCDTSGTVNECVPQ